MNKKAILPLIFAIIFAFSACSSQELTESESSSAATGKVGSAESASTVSASDLFTDRDMEIGYDEATSARITLTGDSASCDSDAVQISGSTVTVTDEGTYILSGALNDGMIVVNAEDTDKVQLVLEGVQITSSTSAAIYVLQADKVFLTTASGTENRLSNGGEYVAIDDNNIDAVIFSKADLTLNGAGARQFPPPRAMASFQRTIWSLPAELTISPPQAMGSPGRTAYGSPTEITRLSPARTGFTPKTQRIPARAFSMWRAELLRSRQAAMG